MYTKHQRRALLEQANVHTWLNTSQLLTIMWWEWFNKKKAKAFYSHLARGMHAPFAYERARNLK